MYAEWESNPEVGSCNTKSQRALLEPLIVFISDLFARLAVSSAWTERAARSDLAE